MNTTTHSILHYQRFNSYQITRSWQSPAKSSCWGALWDRSTRNARRIYEKVLCSSGSWSNFVLKCRATKEAGTNVVFFSLVWDSHPVAFIYQLNLFAYQLYVLMKRSYSVRGDLTRLQGPPLDMHGENYFDGLTRRTVRETVWNAFLFYFKYFILFINLKWFLHRSNYATRETRTFTNVALETDSETKINKGKSLLIKSEH